MKKRIKGHKRSGENYEGIGFGDIPLAVVTFYRPTVNF